MIREVESERMVSVDTYGVARMDYRDLTVTDIVVVEYDSMERCALPEVSERFALPDAVGLEGDIRCAHLDRNVRRVIHIKRQNDIEVVRRDSASVEVRDSLRSEERIQNKSSPDKGSQVIFSTTTIIVILVIILALILLVRIFI